MVLCIGTGSYSQMNPHFFPFKEVHKIVKGGVDQTLRYRDIFDTMTRVFSGVRVYRLIAYQMNLVCLKRLFKFCTELYPLAWLKVQ